MKLKPPFRKALLSLHITVSVGWIGAVIAYLALVFAAMNKPDAETLSSAWFAMERIGWMIIVPLALSSLLTGIIISLGTSWGLFRHYWVLLSLLLTALSTGVLISHMPTVSQFASLASENPAASAAGLGGEVFHAGLGLLILLLAQVLNVYKPRSLSYYGWRKQQEERKLTSRPIAD